MSIYNISEKNKFKIEKLFDNWTDSLIPSAISGCMGYVWCDDEVNPKSAQIINAGFCYFAGEPNEELSFNMPDDIVGEEIILVPLNGKWDRYLCDMYEERITPGTRYAIKRESDTIFNIEKLEGFISRLDNNYSIKDIECNEDIFNQAIAEKWSEDMGINFKSFDDYAKRGMGIGIVHNGKLVAGASSYTVYPEGIEITIHCMDEYRQRGLATVCGAALILKCLKKNLHPNWDARTMISVKLAEKLGYHFYRQYRVYNLVIGA